MPSVDGRASGLISEATQHLAGIFRHLLPGVLVVGGAVIAHPLWFHWLDLDSWRHLMVLSVVTLAVGNTWFALNRFGLHQFIDYVLFLSRMEGPARKNGWFTYLDTLGQYTAASLHKPTDAARAREHVAFRASTVLLLLTLGEAAVLFGIWHAPESVLAGHASEAIIGGLVVFGVGIWQMIITRRIDSFVVNWH